MHFRCQPAPQLQSRSRLHDCVPGRLNWAFCVGIYRVAVYMDGAAAETGWLLLSLLGSERSLLSVSVHGVIRGEMLAS